MKDFELKPDDPLEERDRKREAMLRRLGREANIKRLNATPSVEVTPVYAPRTPEKQKMWDERLRRERLDDLKRAAKNQRLHPEVAAKIKAEIGRLERETPNR